MKPDEGETYWQPDQDEEAPLGDGFDERDEPEEAPDQQPLMWQASEYVQHEKRMLWYVALIAVAVVLLLISIFLIKSWSFAVLVVVLGVCVGVMAGRPPHLINYSLTDEGLSINDKKFSYQDFRAFGVVQDGSLHFLALIPVKRFMPAVNVYFPPEQGEQIVDTLGMYLPMEQIESDMVEKLARRLRF